MHKLRKLNILYCGPNNSEFALRTRPAASVAGNKWSQGLLGGLGKLANVTVLTNTVSRAWPKGRTIWEPGSPQYFDQQFSCYSIGYPSLPFLADRYLACGYRNLARQIMNDTPVDLVVCYNCMQRYHQAVMQEASRRRIPAIPIVLDGSDPRKDNWNSLRHELSFASGVVLLSHWMYKNFPLHMPSFHLDGGASAWRGGDKLAVRRPGKYRLVYSGALSRWNGSDFLLKLLKCCPRNDVEFIICGKVWDGELAAFKKIPFVKLMGFVTEEELHRISLDADVFLNVRDAKWGDNILSFPSKLPQYLSYGKPVVSSPLLCLSPDYRDVISIDDTDSSDGFWSKINRFLDGGRVESEKIFKKTREWFVSNKLWDVQAERLVNWLFAEKIVYNDMERV